MTSSPLRATALAVVALACAPRSAHETDTDRPGEQTEVVRVATWNINGLGAVGSPGYEAVRAVLDRVDPDVVTLNELVELDRRALDVLGEELGYDTVYLPTDNPYGDLRNAVMTRLEVLSVASPDAPSLALDDRARDLTRFPVVLTVRVPDSDRSLQVVGQHLKSGFMADDGFRRAVDAHRTAQALGQGSRLVLGDLNADLAEMPESPPVWTALPGGLPERYRLGADLQAQLPSGIDNDAFAPFLTHGLSAVDARQVDGRLATRPISDRRIDWILVSEDLVDALDAEVYNSLDEGQGGLPKRGPLPPRSACAQASDHLPVFADLSFDL